MKTFHTIVSTRRFLSGEKKKGKTISFVPTMGALHEGHKSCIDAARRAADVLSASVFVNPTQFGPSEDLGAYPRDEQRDLDLLEEWGCDVVFLPPLSEMYPSRQDVWVDAGRLAEPLCGAFRPGHFRGVATVVAKLFHIIEPDIAVFGQKDAQQALVIREMVRQLNMPVTIRLSPTVRDPSGLAVSSRNAYLTEEERGRAAGVYRALRRGQELIGGGERSREAVLREVRTALVENGITEIEYVDLLDAGELMHRDALQGRIILAVSARVGKARLIDNIVLEIGKGGTVEETLLF